jgi:hypothetical protein
MNPVKMSTPKGTAMVDSSRNSRAVGWDSSSYDQVNTERTSARRARSAVTRYSPGPERS